jgi:hypothetical protein
VDPFTGPLKVQRLWIGLTRMMQTAVALDAAGWIGQSPARSLVPRLEAVAIWTLAETAGQSIRREDDTPTADDNFKIFICTGRYTKVRARTGRHGTPDGAAKSRAYRSAAGDSGAILLAQARPQWGRCGRGGRTRDATAQC